MSRHCKNHVSFFDYTTIHINGYVWPNSLYHIHCKHLLMLGVSMCHVGDLPFIVYFSFCTIMDSLQYLDIMKSLFIYARLMLLW